MSQPIVISGLSRINAEKAAASFNRVEPGQWSIELMPEADGTFTLMARRRDGGGGGGGKGPGYPPSRQGGQAQNVGSAGDDEP
jgi:hypothetical protein